MVTLLLRQLFSWLPGSLMLCVWAIVSTMFFVVLVKAIDFIFNFIFKFIDMFKP